MTTYLDLLPDDLCIKIYEDVNRKTLKDAAKVGLRRQIPKVGKKTNQNVIWHWINGKPFKSLHMSTDGQRLYSFNLCIGFSNTNKGRNILLDYTAKGLGNTSHTTSTHVNKARPYVDLICDEYDDDGNITEAKENNINYSTH